MIVTTAEDSYNIFRPNFEPDDDIDEESKEELGWWMGPTKDYGDMLTYYVLSQKTDQLYVRSEIRPADSPRNLRAESDLQKGSGTEGDMTESQNSQNSQNFPFVQSMSDVVSETMYNGQDVSSIPELPHLRFSPDELPGMTFLRETPDGQKVRAEVVRKINDQNAQNHKDIMFILKLGTNDAEELMSYVEICDRLEQTLAEDKAKVENGEKLYFFDEITDHVGPLAPGSKGYNGSRYNVKVRWDDGSETWEPLNSMIAQDPVTCAVYAREKNLGNLDGWKKLKKFIRRAKHLNRLVKKAKTAAARRAPRYKFGVRVPRDYKEARRLQEEAGHTKWTDAEKVEIDQINDYDTLKNMGKGTVMPKEYQKIRVHFVYDAKESGRFKARLVAGGHLTDASLEDSYSGVVSIKSLRLAMIVGITNGLKIQCGGRSIC